MALQYVGGRTVTGNSGTLTLPLTGLTGGIDTQARTGDLVIAIYAAVSTSNLSLTVGDGTWDSPTGLWANDSRDANLRVGKKIMGVTPDTQVQGSGNTTATNGAVMACHVWRGADQATYDDVAMASATGINAATPNPPSITPVTAGAIVIAIGTGSGTAVNNTVTAPSGYSNLVQATVDPGNSITAAIASKAWSGSGAEDPGTFGGITTSTSDGWAAYTIAIRPQANVAPTVTTQAASSITATTATGNGNITATGGENADERGIVYDTATHGDPGNVAPGSSGYAGLSRETGGSFGTGAFTESLTGLSSNTTYFARAYAHNSFGYSYGSEVSFTTPLSFNDVRQAIIDGIDSAQSESTGWDAIRSSIPVTAVVRTSSTVVTITLPALASYDITAAETITATIPGSALAGGSDLVATPTITITTSGGAIAGATIASTTTLFAPSIRLNITGANISSTVVRQPSVAYAVTGAFRTSTLVLSAPTLGYVIAGARIALTTLSPPSIIQNVTAGFRSSTLTMFTPTLTSNIANASIAATALFTPTLTQNVTSATIAATVLHSPSLATVTFVTSGFIASTLALYPASALPVSFVTTGTISSSASLFAPGMGLTLTAATIAGTVLRAPTLALRVTTGTIAAGTALYAPSTLTVTFVTGAFRSSTLTLFAPTMALAIAGATIAPSTTLFPVTLRLNVTTAIIAATTLSPPLVIASGAISTGTVAGTQLFAPAMALVSTVGTIVSGSVVRAPSVAVSLSGAYIASDASLFGASVAETVIGAFRAAAAVLFAPILAYQLLQTTIPPTSILYAPSAGQTMTGAVIEGTVVYGPSVFPQGFVYYVKYREMVARETRYHGFDTVRQQHVLFENRYIQVERN